MMQAQLTRAIVRRWYAALAGLFLTAGLVLAAAVLVPPRYQATGDMLLLPPVSPTAQGGGLNPYLSLGGLESFTEVVARSMSDSTTADALQREGMTGTYTVSRDFRTSGPLLLITVTDTTPQAALASLRKLVDRTPVVLRNLQQVVTIPSQYFITTSTVARDDVATPVRKSQLRAMLVGLAAGLAMTLFGVALLDGWLMRRSRIAEVRTRSTASERDRRRGDGSTRNARRRSDRRDGGSESGAPAA